jgi:hypothetical protein
MLSGSVAKSLTMAIENGSSAIVRRKKIFIMLNLWSVFFTINKINDDDLTNRHLKIESRQNIQGKMATYV